uniref:Uncharacterized protein n=1 Tax=viral metagenome TaxID=1070528 RepID=A0A6M3K501_9ZZZZ
MAKSVDVFETVNKLGNSAIGFVAKHKKEFIIGGSVILIYLIIKKLGKNSQIAPYNPDETRTTISNDDAMMISDSLFASMNRVGTDEATIFRLIEPLSTDDLKLVIQKFGVRPYGLHSGCSGTLGDLFCTPLNLPAWFKRELTKKEEAKMRDLFKAKEIPF